MSCSVRAHPAREHLVGPLVERLGVGDDAVVWDERNDSWHTGRRAWEAHDPAADWHLVVEDDALVCRDLLAGLAVALEALPERCVVSLYLGAAGHFSAKVVRRAAGPGWVEAEKLVWGVALAAPTGSIADMVASCSKQARFPSRVYDTRIARHYREFRRWPAFFAWPSLVEHGDQPSLLGHQDGRRAAWFIGEDASAIDWAKEQQ